MSDRAALCKTFHCNRTQSFGVFKFESSLLKNMKMASDLCIMHFFAQVMRLRMKFNVFEEEIMLNRFKKYKPKVE